jgi:hypothetical protein
MRRTAGIILLLLVNFFAKAQVIFKTIVPQEAVVEGESFRVQYVAEDAEKISSFTAPSFKRFRQVGSPEIYHGQGMLAGKPRTFKNTIYTLEAIRPGRYFLPGALATIDGKNFRSNDVWVVVISRKQADKQRKQNGGAEDNSMYFLKPGDDPYDIIRKNLFVKVMVNKKTCFAGEPVVATFKLYSRLRSRSDIIKNPGFYGFTVQDMVNLEDKILHTETLHGEPFDVHTIREVQLYPLQAGIFMVDAMEIKSRIEFSRSAVSKKTDQKIIEGIFENNDPAPEAGTEVFENRISTEPVTITVKPSPAKNKPVDFNGATGRFLISTSIEKKELAKNEEGYYVIQVKGKGNFSQLAAPVIAWPEGIEGFEPKVTDTLDKTSAPLQGTRTFRYAFVAANPGVYQLPSSSFSFFDPDSNRYKTVSEGPLTVTVNNREREKSAIVEKKTSISIVDANRKASLVAAGIMGLLLLAVVTYWITKRKEPLVVIDEVNASSKAIVPANEMLKPAYLLIPAADKDFYAVLQQAIFNFFRQYFDLTGNGMNKETLSVKLKESQISTSLQLEVLNLLQRCETGIYTGASMDEDREILLSGAKGTLDKFDAEFSGIK